MADVNHSIPIIFSVLEGKHPGGKIYVDQKVNPQYALITTEVDYYYLLGLLTEETSPNFVNELISGILKPNNKKEMILFNFSEKNRKLLDLPFQNKGVIQIMRKTFDFNPTMLNEIKDPYLSSKHVIKEMDNQLANQLQIYHFNQDAFGLCLMEGNHVISYIYSIFIGKRMVEIDVQTCENHRGKGYGYIIGYYFIKECLKRRFKPDWSCWPHNQASSKLAVKLGFKESETIPAFFWLEHKSK